MNILVVKIISGDYATLTDSSGEEILVALALLPFDIDVGSRLVYDGAEFKYV